MSWSQAAVGGPGAPWLPRYKYSLISLSKILSLIPIVHTALWSWAAAAVPAARPFARYEYSLIS